MAQIGNNTSLSDNLIDDVKVDLCRAHKVKNVIKHIQESKAYNRAHPTNQFGFVFPSEEGIQITLHNQFNVMISTLTTNEFSIRQVHNHLVSVSREFRHLSLEVYPQGTLKTRTIKEKLSDLWIVFYENLSEKYYVIHESYLNRKLVKDLFTVGTHRSSLSMSEKRSIKELFTKKSICVPGTVENLIHNSLIGYRLTLAIDKNRNQWVEVSQVKDQSSTGKVITVRVRDEKDANFILRKLNDKLRQKAQK